MIKDNYYYFLDYKLYKFTRTSCVTIRPAMNSNSGQINEVSSLRNILKTFNLFFNFDLTL